MSEPKEMSFSLRWAREWDLLWFGVVPATTWARYDSDKPSSPRARRKAPVAIWAGPI